MKVTCPKCNASADVEVKPGGAVVCSCGGKFSAPLASPPGDSNGASQVTLVDVRMPFRRMVVLFIKVWAASIVAVVVVMAIPVFLGFLFGLFEVLSKTGN